MVIGVLLAAAVLGVIVFALLLIFRGDLVGVDLSGASLLRLYLYLASLAGILVGDGDHEVRDVLTPGSRRA